MNGRHFATRMMWFAALWAMGVAITAIVGLVIKVWLGA